MIRRRTGPCGSRRRGFTLLEVMLASAIALLLMGGLYVAMEVQIRLTHEAREVVDQSTLSRSLIHRLTTDLTPSLSPVLGRSQFSGSGAGATAGSSSSTTGSGTTGSGTTGSSATGGSSGTSSGTSGMTQSTETSSTAVPFQAGVVGSSQQLTIYVTRLPGQGANSPGSPAASSGGDSAATPSDLRRISYWIASTGGLARHETPWLTDAQLMNSTDPDFSNETQSVIADEVTDVLFEYWDGSAWQSSWDGTQLSDDQKTPIGPPMAIAVTLTIKVGGKSAEKRYRHVIAIPTAPSPSTSASTTTSGTTGSGTMGSQ